jgi:asparagine N-glycosylation enzyme membrane subunit Stt3
MTLRVERRRPALTPDLLLRVALAWAMIAALLLVTNLQAILAYHFPDPDDTLRLVQVRDLIAGQGWFDLTQHRIDAADGGVPMHWSRLVDLPLAGVILALRGLIGQHAAETVALILVPLLTFGCALLLAGRIAWRVIGDEAAGFACLAMALSVPLVQQLRPMRIDHHGWQIVCVLVAMNGLMARSPRRGGWATGVALAAGLSISIEGLPLAAAICGVIALRWLRDRHDASWR